ncbi:MAG: hypothetical protein WCP28_08170 [Actinomycetes bacterium]
MTDTPDDPNLHWDGQRWTRWNGTAWTDATTGEVLEPEQPVLPAAAPTQPTEAAAFDGPVGAPEVPTQPKNRTPLIIAAVVVVLLVLGGVAFGAVKIVGARNGDTVAPTPTPSILPNTETTGPSWSGPTESPLVTPTAPDDIIAPIPTSSLPTSYNEELHQAIVAVCTNKYISEFQAVPAIAGATCECIWRGYVAAVPYQDFLGLLSAGPGAPVPDWAKTTEAKCLQNQSAY